MEIFTLILLIVAVSGDQMHPRRAADIDPSFIHWNLQDPASISNDVYTQKWIRHGEDFIKDRVKLDFNTNKAKNIILMIGDGMGITTTSAARAYLDGEETKLSFENFPYYGLTKTYCVNRQVPDSACTATAFLGLVLPCFLPSLIFSFFFLNLLVESKTTLTALE